MSTILEKCNQIKHEKDTEILPQNVRAGVQIFDINGEYEGLDTSNATATASDILAGKTAYVNGEMITGDIMSYSGVDVDAVNAGSWVDEQIIYTNGHFASTAVLEKNGMLGVKCPFGYIANAIGLTSNQITVGNNVLGIEGTAQVGELTEEEYNAALALTESILGNVQTNNPSGFIVEPQMAFVSSVSVNSNRIQSLDIREDNDNFVRAEMYFEEGLSGMLTVYNDSADIQPISDSVIGETPGYILIKGQHIADLDTYYYYWSFGPGAHAELCTGAYIEDFIYELVDSIRITLR